MTVEPLEGGNVCVALRGELDLNRAYTFDEELRQLEVSQPPVLVLDVRELAFLDSSGLGRVLACHRRARRDGRRMVVTGATGAVRRMFAFAALDEVLELTSDGRAAAALSAGS